jgi:hypothetical protein
VQVNFSKRSKSNTDTNVESFTASSRDSTASLTSLRARTYFSLASLRIFVVEVRVEKYAKLAAFIASDRQDCTSAVDMRDET